MNLNSKMFFVSLAATIFGFVLTSAAIAENHLSKSINDLAWENGGPGLDFALVWGDWTKNDYGMIVRIKAGSAAPEHSHTSDYHGVTIQGKWVHTFGKDDHRTMPPGSYAFQSGKEDHGDRCAGPQDCLILIHQHGPRDFILPGK